MRITLAAPSGFSRPLRGGVDWPRFFAGLPKPEESRSEAVWRGAAMLIGQRVWLLVVCGGGQCWKTSVEKRTVGAVQADSRQRDSYELTRGPSVESNIRCSAGSGKQIESM